MALEIAEAHGFNASAHACGRPAVSLQAWVAAVAALAGGFVGKVFPGGGAPEGRVAFVPADGTEESWTPEHPCEQLIAALPDPASRERARSWAAALAALCDGRRPLEASWGDGTAFLDLARGRHKAGAAVQEGSTFTAFPGAEPERARAPKAAAAFGMRIRSLREGGGEGFLASISETGEALLVLGDAPADAEEAGVLLADGRATVMAGGTAAGHGPVPDAVFKALMTAPSMRAAVPDGDGGLRTLQARLLSS